MKRRAVILSIFAILIASSAGIFLLLAYQKDFIFWTAFSSTELSLLLAGITTYLCSLSDRRSLPVNLSVIGVSYLYVGACALANILIGWIFKLEPSVFLAIHLAVLAIFTVILILLFAARSIITAQHKNQDKNGCQDNIR